MYELFNLMIDYCIDLNLLRQIFIKIFSFKLSCYSIYCTHIKVYFQYNVDNSSKFKMRKIYRQIRMCSILTILIIISFIIHSYFTVAVSSLGKRRYRNIGSHKYLWNRLLGHSAEYCLRQKRRFWNKVLNEHIDIQSLNCFRRDENKTGIFSYFVPENFEEVRCSNKTVQFSKTNMTQVKKVGAGHNHSPSLIRVFAVLSYQ